ncbi:aminomethyltransferase family protein [Mesorhizobium sp. WSM4976]|uniref:aminomethyltransferase family protein n=1 Tax=Mesorhizobium sp. WSM4976 TaxID=3038549 RepID=UPI0024176048|nr:aminomethyltransferase family protein [Mesorhizobium sp. WSM4976]MDG4897639.1 aminomethyltransferase family protein [Mesorhizobium sp. WSM4976]
MTAKRTPLYHAFLARNAQMAEKAHFLTANVFTDAKTEHRAVRNAAGLFEIFGQFLVEVAGKQAERFLNETLVAEVTNVAPGRGVYCGILNEQGGYIDDVITYRPESDLFWVVPAPHRVDRVETYLRERGAAYGVHAVALGYRYVSLSLQGPRSRDCLAAVTDADLSNTALPAFGLLTATVADIPGVAITRTGFTGELGYELWVPTEYVESFYDALLNAGKPFGLVPCGAGSMGSLRIEKRYPIWGRDIGEDTTPVEAGLGWTVKPKDADYPGKAVVERQKRDGTERLLVLLELPEWAALPEMGATVTHEGAAVGKVTSVAMGHTVGRPLALAYVKRDLVTDGRVVNLPGDVAATVHPRALYDPKSTRPRI